MSSGESSGPVAKGVCKFYFVFFVVAKEELIGSKYWKNIIKMTTNLSRKHSEKKNSQAPNVACCIVTLFFQNLGRHIVCCEKKFPYHLFIKLREHSLKVTCVAGSHEHPIISSQLLGKTKVTDPTQIITIISSEKHNWRVISLANILKAKHFFVGYEFLYRSIAQATLLYQDCQNRLHRGCLMVSGPWNL